MNKTINLIFRCVALAMGVAVVTLRILNKIDNSTAALLIGIGLVAISISQFDKEK